MAVSGIILQPLVENAIKHGRETSRIPLKVRVHLFCPDCERVYIEVSNTGDWIESEQPRKAGGIGLENLRRRLDLLYPNEHHLMIAKEDGWVTVRIFLLRACEMPTPLRALIVDDEAPARELLRALLAVHTNVEVVGEACSVSTAATLCGDLQPNLIFLDVQMPGGDGFSLLGKLDPLPAIIFVTGYDKFAVRAFEVNAVDYLLKPVSSHAWPTPWNGFITLPQRRRQDSFYPMIAFF